MVRHTEFRTILIDDKNKYVLFDRQTYTRCSIPKFCRYVTLIVLGPKIEHKK